MQGKSNTGDQPNSGSQQPTTVDTGTGNDADCKGASAESSIQVEKDKPEKASACKSRLQTLSNKYEYLLDSASLEDLSMSHQGPGNGKDAGELDLNDELQLMQDLNCFNIYRRRVKKGRKYKEWKKDEIRDADGDQMKFLEKQIHRMRKKEENQVQRKTVTKRNTTTYGASHHHHQNHTQYNQNVNGDLHRPGSTSNPPLASGHNQHLSGNLGANSNFSTSAAQAHGPGGNSTGMGMNMRTRLKF